MEKNKVMPYVTNVSVALALFALCAVSNGLFSAETQVELVKILCDCFTVPGVFMTGFGLLSLIASTGAYDIMSYGVSYLISMFIRHRERAESFYDYKLERAEKRKKWGAHTLIVGLVCFVAGLICLAVYYSIL